MVGFASKRPTSNAERIGLMAAVPILVADTPVHVRRNPRDWKTAVYRFGDVSDLRWDTFCGGVGRGTPQPMLFGYVWCDGMISGRVAHSCIHGPPPHHIKVCLVKKLNAPIWRQILERAPPRPMKVRRRRALSIRPADAPDPEAAPRLMSISSFSGSTSHRVADALVAAGVDGPERLLLMSEREIAVIKGIGKVALEEIRQYRTRMASRD